MKFAPIGFGCYFSYSLSQTGATILENYAKIFILFLLFSILFYLVILAKSLRVEKLLRWPNKIYQLNILNSSHAAGNVGFSKA